MIAKILCFELRCRFKNPITLLFLLMMAGQGIWYTLGIYKYVTSADALVNGSGVFYQCMAAGGLLMIVMVAMITVATLYRDRVCRSASYIYTLPVNEKKFFIGHFLSAYSINCLIVLAYPLGMILIKYIKVVEPGLLGPVPLWQLAHGFVILMLPNLFVLSAICYVCLVFTRKISSVYIGVAVVAIIHALCDTMSVNSPHTQLLSILDPFGSVYTWHMLSLMSVEIKNSGFLPLTPIFYLNRGLWIGASLIGLSACYHKFCFQYFYQGPADKKNRESKRADSEDFKYRSQNKRRMVPSVSLHYGTCENIKKVCRLSVTEFLSVVRPVSFRIIFAIMVILILLLDLVWNATYYIGFQQAVTSGMTCSRVTNGFIIIIVMMIWSAELFFREKTTGFWQIAGAAPAPNWVQQLPKLIAMALVAFLVALAFLCAGLLAQLIRGFRHIDLCLYIYDLFGYSFGWLTYLLNIIFVFFLAGVTGHRYLTHILSAGLYIFLLFSVDLHLIEQVRFCYALVPGISAYSEMSGYGIWAKASPWYFCMWSCLALFFVLFSLQVWQRGTHLRFFDQSRLTRRELGLPAKFMMVIFFALFLGLQMYIFEKVNTQRNYISSAQTQAEAAAYEKKYLHLPEQSCFDLCLYTLKADFFPEKRKAQYLAKLSIKNMGKKAVSRVYLNFDYFTKVSSITADHQPLERLERDGTLGMSVYQLPLPLKPGNEIRLCFNAVKAYKGFAQGRENPQPDLAYNGLFFTSAVPFAGLDPKKTLQGNRDRMLHGLAKLSSRMPEIQDENALNQDFVSFVGCPRDHGVTITVSTTAPQLAFAPGKLIRRWSENGRNKAVFRITRSKFVQPFMGSARYQSHMAVIDKVNVCFMYHPAHEDNLETFTTAVEAGLDFINTNLGAYPYNALRIVEIPYFQDASYVMDNTIALSEKQGWYGDTGVKEIQDYIQYVLARDLMRQWLASQMTIARVQGADMLWSGLPSAFALQVINKRFGPERAELLMKKLRNKYRKQRTLDPNKEQPLLYGDNQEYLEKNKGVMALYRLAESMGFNDFNQKVSTWIMKQDKPLVFRDFYMFLQADGQFDPAFRDLFETVKVMETF